MFRFFARKASPAADSPLDGALTALRQRDFARAERELTQLLAEMQAREPAKRAFLLNKRGVARAGLQRLEAAAADFEDALFCLAAYAPALTNIGNLLLERGETQAAIARFEEAIAADPAYALAYQNLAVAYKRSGRIPEAVKALRQAQRFEKTSSGRRRRRL